ncbi:hypothetical protein K458DRAFT_354399 [Lentithecium fluviatile CBS 122367]|uniref:Azaphilone pigments biosynthesis cluster protein L N-terminal domain-containing protein n=1 Tax=Lentithecium fluviatile CBS 122367 TaxID=1168545 RepID=A0A6G1JNL8_9PLEO|nr:hypothetical protein K458DRAFT_354399 [Lentithecium fluviatile CBS 122367]
MDPLSIGSAVVGLIAAASRIAPVLQHFISHTRDSPKSASQVLSEMQSITAALEQLQVYLTGASQTSAGRRAMLSLRAIVTSMTACVTTYSDLERVVGKCVVDGQVKRAKWVYYESEIAKLVQKVQANKLSLIFMLTILQCESQQEAENSTEQLTQTIERLIQSNGEIRSRIDAMSIDHTPVAPTSLGSTSEATSNSDSQKWAFEEDLNNSRVYKKLRPQDSAWSISNSERASMALSIFSDLTLANVSAISVLRLPVWSNDLSNPAHYRFESDIRALFIDEMLEHRFGKMFQDPDAANLGTGHIFNESIHLGAGHAVEDNQDVENVPRDDHAPSIFSRDEREVAKIDPKVQFIAASRCVFTQPELYEIPNFKGYPWLEYRLGQAFDIMRVEDTYWLARNRNTPRVEGWVCARDFYMIVG